MEMPGPPISFGRRLIKDWSSFVYWIFRYEKRGLRETDITTLSYFQTSYLGMPGGDVMRVISTFLSNKDRKEHWDELIEFFYKAFMSMIGDATPPYGLEQLHENIRRYYPMVRLAFAIPLSFAKNENSFDEETKRKVSLETLIANSGSGKSGSVGEDGGNSGRYGLLS